MCGTPSTKPTLSALSSHLLYQLYLSLVILINFRSVVEFNFWSRRPHVSNLLMIQYGIGRTVTLLIFKMPSVFSLKKIGNLGYFLLVPRRYFSVSWTLWYWSCLGHHVTLHTIQKLFNVSDISLSDNFSW